MAWNYTPSHSFQCCIWRHERRLTFIYHLTWHLHFPCEVSTTRGSWLIRLVDMAGATLGKLPSSFYKAKPTSTLDSASPILNIYLRQMKTNVHKKKKKNLCINVCNSSKLETAHMSICRWISKLWSISKIEYYSGIRKNRLVTQMCNLISFTQISNTGENSVEKFRTALPLKTWGYRSTVMRHEGTWWW